MTDTKSFSLPEEMTEKIERFALITRRTGSAIAVMAFEEFFARKDISDILNLKSAKSEALEDCKEG